MIFSKDELIKQVREAATMFPEHWNFSYPKEEVQLTVNGEKVVYSPIVFLINKTIHRSFHDFSIFFTEMQNYPLPSQKYPLYGEMTICKFPDRITVFGRNGKFVFHSEEFRTPLLPQRFLKGLAFCLNASSYFLNERYHEFMEVWDNTYEVDRYNNGKTTIGPYYEDRSIDMARWSLKKFLTIDKTSL